MSYIFIMHPRNRVRELRKRAGITQEDLGKLAGVSQEAISQVENDKRPLTVDWMRTFARIFGCTTADILAEEDNPDRLSNEERALIDHFRSVDQQHRVLIQRVAEPTQEFNGPEPTSDRLRVA